MGIMFLRFPIPLRLWIGTLIVINMGGIALYEGPEVMAAAIIFNVGAMIMSYIYSQHGFVRLLGVGHIGWPPMMAWIWFVRLPEIEDESLHSWLTALVVINGLSVILDTMDVIKYINGEKKPTMYWDKTKAH